MSTGKNKPLAHRAAGLRFANDRLIVLFRDGRELHLPLQLYPTLLDATPQQRKAWQMVGPGKAFHWKDLDLDLSIDGLTSYDHIESDFPPLHFRQSVCRFSAIVCPPLLHARIWSTCKTTFASVAGDRPHWTHLK